MEPRRQAADMDTHAQRVARAREEARLADRVAAGVAQLGDGRAARVALTAFAT